MTTKNKTNREVCSIAHGLKQAQKVRWLLFGVLVEDKLSS